MHCSDSALVVIQAGARSSPLSRAQVKEIEEALSHHYPLLRLDVHYMATSGDLDQKTSLRTLEKDDFFTKEIDNWVLDKKGRIGIHSAKDLPFPLKEGLALFCMTRGLDPSDSLVMREGDRLETLPSKALIATSSARREEMVRLLRADVTFCDLRGTIAQRLDKLETGEADGVVVAEAALIRLGLTRLNRISLPGPTAEGQGRLAIVGRADDSEMRALFSCLNDSI